ncbi:MAG: hypothetical protein GX941_09300 [Candidatus Methanofastidiosa archaeon]|nr:hypothetical protein [Candidatus Methanofastidiosa archaeon]NMA31981.1 hypothetical protein [Candidatus Methanofastidiosa archaeon]
MSCMNTLNCWQKPPKDSMEGGEIFEKWLRNTRNPGDNSMLIICGAGISMSGAAPSFPGRWLKNGLMQL